MNDSLCNSSPKLKSLPLFVLSLLAVLTFFTSSIWGQTTNWSAAVSGNFDDQSRWSSGVPDSETDFGFLESGSPFSVVFRRNGYGNEMTIANDVDVLFEDTGTYGLILSGNSIVNGTLSINDLTINSLSSAFIVGDDQQSGAMNISGGAVVNSSSGYLGVDRNATGAVEVEGAGSQWNISDRLYLGWGDHGPTGATGNLTVSNGGKVVSDQIYGSFQVRDVSNVLVTGAGSRLESRHTVLGFNGLSNTTIQSDAVLDSDSLIIGSSGYAYLSLLKGGQLISETTRIGSQNDGPGGNVFINGTFGSSWTNSGKITLGNNSGVSVISGGLVTSQSIEILNSSGTEGTLAVEGQGSLIEIEGDLDVGSSSANGSVSITQEGRITASEINVRNGTFEVNGGTFSTAIGSTVTGSNSRFLTNGGNWYSTGVFHKVLDGANSEWGNMYVDEGFGFIQVSDQDSNLSIDGDLVVGIDGTASGYFNNSSSVSVGDASADTGLVVIGDRANSDGRIFVDSNSSLNGGHRIIIGNSGSSKGTLNIWASGSVSSNYGNIGQQNGASGTVNVVGENAQWSLNNNLFIGGGGEGTLSIGSGGDVENNYGYIGYESTGSGSASLSNGGTWTSRETLYVGLNGQGELNIDSGMVESGSSRMGFYLGSVGTANISGPESRWNSTDRFSVGYNGTGNLNIDSGGQVTSLYSYVGHQASGDGTATVSGSGSALISNNSMFVGTFGIGTLNIDEGGIVQDKWGYIGYDANATGTLNVDGPGSHWLNSNQAFVGVAGEGTLNITNGGSVSGINGRIATEEGGTGIVNVDGEGSQWLNSSTVNVGEDGTGSLFVTSGGLVQNHNSWIGGNGTGTATIKDTGSTWNMADELYVGLFGEGALNVDSGGKVTSLALRIGDDNGGVGYVNSSGIGTRIEVGNEVSLGRLGGHGELTIENLAIVTVADSVHIGESQNMSNGTGSVLLKTGGALSVVEDVIISQNGSLEIDGGSLTASRLLIENGATFEMTSGTIDAAQILSDSLLATNSIINIDVISGFAGGQTNFIQNGGIMRPGDSPGETLIDGNYAVNGGLIEIEIGGESAGTEYDQISVNGDFSIATTILDVAIIDGFELSEGNEFLIFDIANSRSGYFVGLDQNALVRSIDGFNLFIDYEAGDGNDIGLFSIAVPEPNSICLICFTLMLLQCQRIRPTLV